MPAGSASPPAYPGSKVQGPGFITLAGSASPPLPAPVLPLPAPLAPLPALLRAPPPKVAHADVRRVRRVSRCHEGVGRWRREPSGQCLRRASRSHGVGGLTIDSDEAAPLLSFGLNMRLNMPDRPLLSRFWLVGLVYEESPSGACSARPMCATSPCNLRGKVAILGAVDLARVRRLRGATILASQIRINGIFMANTRRATSSQRKRQLPHQGRKQRYRNGSSTR